jgi:hypothetical protein
MNRLTYILYRICVDIISLISRSLNAFVFNGSTAQTLSARAYIEEGWSTHRRIINAIFFWQEDHCKNAWELEVKRAKYVVNVLVGRDKKS